MSDTDKVREAISKGNVRFSERAADAIANLDLDNPDFTIAQIELESCWGPWHKTAKDGKTPLGNNGGFSVEYVFKSAGCGRATIYKGDDGRLHCYNQGMGRQFIKELLARLVDEMEFDTEYEKEKTDNGSGPDTLGSVPTGQ